MKKFCKAFLMFTMFVAFAVIFTACKKSDKEVVFDAFKALAEAKGFDVAKEMGIKEVFDKLDKKAYETGIELALEKSDIYQLSMLETASLELKVANDPVAEKSGIELGAGVAGIKFLSAEGYFDDKQVALKVPQLIDKVFVLDYSGNILEKAKNSALIKVMGIDAIEVEDIIKIYTEALKNKNGQTEQLLELMEYCEEFEKKTKAYADFKDAIKVTAIDSKEFEISGKVKKCDGYEMVITTESVVDLCKKVIDYFVVSEKAQKLWKGYMETEMSSVEGTEGMSANDFIAEYDSFIAEYEATQEEMWANVENTFEDINMELFISAGEIVSLEGELVLAVDNIKAGFPFSFVCTGGENSIYENFVFELDLTAADAGKVVIERATESDKEVYETLVNVKYEEDINIDCEFSYYKEDKNLELSIDADVYNESAGVTVKADLDELEKGKSFTLDIDEISVVYEDKTFCTLSGEFYLSSDVEIEFPSGDKFDVLTSDEDEFMKVMNEIMTVVESFSSLFGY